MSNTIESILEANGLRRVSYLSEIIEADSFFVDSVIRGGNDFAVYPVNKKKVNLTHDLLSLYGVHWRYLVDAHDWNDLRKDDGDLHVILEDIRKGKPNKRHSRYAFTQKNVAREKSLWVFVPKTKGWEFYQDILIPRYRCDMAEYESLKS